MHPGTDAYMEYMQKRHDNLDLKAAAAVIQHLTVHGVDKKEIEKAICGCGVSNVQIRQSAQEPVPQR